MKNKLTLKTERLNELTTDELHSVAGAQQQTLQVCASLLVNCGSVRICSTVQSCGCAPTWNCA
jgi:hypothetical protein